jgi:hypothetical protein
MSMELLLSAAMGLRDGSTYGYSHTPQITQRSISSLLLSASHAHRACCRVLIALIRNRGKCPCPRCLIPMSRLHNLGMRADMRDREALKRVADARQLSNITSSRSIIYEQGYAVDSQAIDNILKEESWVGNIVRSNNLLRQQLIHPHTECVFETSCTCRF